MTEPYHMGGGVPKRDACRLMICAPFVNSGSRVILLPMRTFTFLMLTAVFVFSACSSRKKKGEETPKSPAKQPAPKHVPKVKQAMNEPPRAPHGTPRVIPVDGPPPKSRVSQKVWEKHMAFAKKLQKSLKNLSFRLVAIDSAVPYMKNVAKALHGAYGSSSSMVLQKGPGKGFQVVIDQYGSTSQSTLFKSMFLEAPVAYRADPKPQERAWEGAHKKLKRLFATAGGKDPVPLPAGYEVVYQKDALGKVAGTKRPKMILRAMLLHKESVLAVTDIESSRIVYGGQSLLPVLTITLTPAGGTKFAAFTKTHLGRKIAMVYGDWILHAPVIQAPMYRKIQITAPYLD